MTTSRHYIYTDVPGLARIATTYRLPEADGLLALVKQIVDERQPTWMTVEALAFVPGIETGLQLDRQLRHIGGLKELATIESSRLPSLIQGVFPLTAAGTGQTTDIVSTVAKSQYVDLHVDQGELTEAYSLWPCITMGMSIWKFDDADKNWYLRQTGHLACRLRRFATESTPTGVWGRAEAWGTVLKIKPFLLWW